MFQEKDIEAYAGIKAPVELKNRVKQSVERQRKIITKQSIAGLSAAACLVIILFSGSFAGSGGAVVSVNNAPVSFEAVELKDSAGYGLVTASRMRSSGPQIQVPLELHVTKATHISISQGTLQETVGAGSESDCVTEMNISESTVVNWTVNADVNDSPTCTITTGGKEYVYVIEFEEDKAVFTIRQKQ